MPDAIHLRKSRKVMEAEAHGDGETLARHKAAPKGDRKEVILEQL